MVMEHLALLTELLVGKVPIRYARHKDRLYIDADWNTIGVGSYLLVEAYEIVDPTVYTDAWNDRWLQNYATALIKRQWGSNLTKFTGMNLPGGVQFNGEKIYNDAVDEITKMEQEMISGYSLPVLDMIG
jgi:GNAT superfamily N-acetyltransferase